MTSGRNQQQETRGAARRRPALGGLCSAAALCALLVAGLLGSAATATAQWTVTSRTPLPRVGPGMTLQPAAGSGEGPLRIALVGSYTSLLDGSEIDALGSEVGGVRDPLIGPLVSMPPGSQLIEEDPSAHRYVFEVPRAASTPLRLNLFGLASRHLVTVSEADASLRGAIFVEHLVPPPVMAGEPGPDPLPGVTRVESSGATWLGVAGVTLTLALIGLVVVRRRRRPLRQLIRRAERAHGVIATEVLAIGPAYDPVAASAARLLEAARQSALHSRSLTAAVERTAWMESTDAAAQRMRLVAKRADADARLEEIVARLEATATRLAGQAADASRAEGVERMVSELAVDLDAAFEAESEVARA